MSFIICSAVTLFLIPFFPSNNHETLSYSFLCKSSFPKHLEAGVALEGKQLF